MIWRIGIDTGGTFTDIAGMNQETGVLSILKVHSTPDDPGEAVAHGIKELCDRHGIDPSAIETIIHGSTVATNAVLEHKGAKTAFITTHGFRDVLLIQRQNRQRLYDLTCRRAEPLLPRASIFEVEERILVHGTIEIPLQEESLEAIARQIKEAGYESIVIGFLHSTINPAHELKAGKYFRRELPEISVSLSHQVVGSQGEYERFSTGVINSYVQPKMQGYLNRFSDRLHSLKTDARLYIMKSNGGMTTPKVARQRCVQTLISGPSGGVIAGRHLAGSGRPNLITADVGGTSFDVSLIHEGDLAYADKSEINGLAINLPMIDIHTVGAGGGSIGWIDAGGALRVGPHSAGADPGPACYGRGGTLPTVTDANLVLGRIAAQSSLAGGMELELAAARTAIESHLASKLGMSIEATAEGMIHIINARMTAAIRKLTVERGHDPESFSLCMFGGTGPLHGAELAEEMGIKEVIIPTMPGVFSAFGLLICEMREEQIQSYLRLLPETDEKEMETEFRKLADTAGSRLNLSVEKPGAHQVIRRLQLRYQGQSHMIPIDLPMGSIRKKTIRQMFNQAHEQRFGYAFAEEPVEIVNLWAIVTLKREGFSPPSYQSSGSSPQKGLRKVYLEGEEHETPIYDRLALASDTNFIGPAILEQIDTTTLVLPHQKATVDYQGNLILKSRKGSD